MKTVQNKSFQSCHILHKVNIKEWRITYVARFNLTSRRVNLSFQPRAAKISKILGKKMALNQ